MVNDGRGGRTKERKGREGRVDKERIGMTGEDRGLGCIS